MASFIQTEEINEFDFLDDKDMELIQIFQNFEKEKKNKIPEPTMYNISNHSICCYIGNNDYKNSELMMNSSLVVKHITKKILEDNILHPVENPVFQSLKIDEMKILLDDDIYRKKKKKLENSILIHKNVYSDDECKNDMNEFYNPFHINGTKERLQKFIDSYNYNYISSNGRQKKEKDKIKEKESYDKQNIVTTYYLNESENTPVLETKKKKNNEISVVDEHSLKNELFALHQNSLNVVKENEHMYNCCSIVVKPSPNIKAVNILLFSNGMMTITGSLHKNDGYLAAKLLLDELKNCPDIFQGIKRLDANARTKSAQKKNKIIFPIPSNDYVEKLDIVYYAVTSMNANFKANFDMDLFNFYKLLTKNEDLYVKYEPNKYRGIQINYFWNKNNDENILEYKNHFYQDGLCRCSKTCSAKKDRKISHSIFDVKNEANTLNTNSCVKVSISVFKNGSINIMASKSEEQTDSAYYFVNQLLEKYYKDIVTTSIHDIENTANEYQEEDEEEEIIKVEKVKEKKSKEKKIKETKTVKPKEKKIETVKVKENVSKKIKVRFSQN